MGGTLETTPHPLPPPQFPFCSISVPANFIANVAGGQRSLRSALTGPEGDTDAPVVPTPPLKGTEYAPGLLMLQPWPQCQTQGGWKTAFSQQACPRRLKHLHRMLGHQEGL